MSTASAPEPPDGTLMHRAPVADSNKSAVSPSQKTAGLWPDRALGEPRAMQQSELDDYQYSGEHPWRDEETLRELAVDQHLSSEDIADLLGCDNKTVLRWQDKFGIERFVPWRDEDTLRRLYVDKGLTQYEIADCFDVDQTTIAGWMQEHGIEPITPEWNAMKPTASYQTCDSGHERWKSGSEKLDNATTVYVHRLAAVAWFGWDAVEDMVIHHENNIPWDNRKSNLKPMTHSDHNTHHNRERWDRVGWEGED